MNSAKSSAGATLSDRFAIAALLLVANSVAFGIFAAAVLANDVWELAFWRRFVFGGFAITVGAAVLGFVAGPAAMARFLDAAPGTFAKASREPLLVFGALCAVGWVVMVEELL